MVDLVHAYQTRCKFKLQLLAKVLARVIAKKWTYHVVPERNDNELCVLRPLLDVRRHDRYLIPSLVH